MVRNVRFWILLALGLLAGLTGANAQEHITINAAAPAHPLPHFWERMFGSGRAVLSLRDSYRQDLRDVKRVTSFGYVRFHGILMDEVGVYDEDLNGLPVYNFSYIDQIYDGLLLNGVRPFVELSFMPKKLAAQQLLHPFWYKQNISPPKDYARWDGLIRALATHLVERYGIAEVSQWYFEVWNEPNLDFWAGCPDSPATGNFMIIRRGRSRAWTRDFASADRPRPKRPGCQISFSMESTRTYYRFCLHPCLWR